MPASAEIELILDDSRFQKALARTSSTLTSLGNSLRVVGRASRNLLIVSGGALAGFLKIASDFEETSSKFEAVFKTQTDAARAWVADQAKALNRSVVSLQGYMARLQDTFVPFGFAREKAFELSKQLTLLGSDLASFNNVADDEVMTLLTSALVGNHEAVRRFGISITEASLKQELFNMGVKKNINQVTIQEKVMARLAIIMRSTADAQGDAARTSESAENQIKGLGASFKDTATAIGNVFIPSLKTGIASIREWLGITETWVKANESLVLSLSKVSGALLLIGAVLPTVLIASGGLIAALGKIGPVVGGAILAFKNFAAWLGLVTLSYKAVIHAVDIGLGVLVAKVGAAGGAFAVFAGIAAPILFITAIAKLGFEIAKTQLHIADLHRQIEDMGKLSPLDKALNTLEKARNKVKEGGTVDEQIENQKALVQASEKAEDAARTNDLVSFESFKRLMDATKQYKIELLRLVKGKQQNTEETARTLKEEKALTKAIESSQKKIDSLTQSFESQLATAGMTKAQVKLYKLELQELHGLDTTRVRLLAQELDFEEKANEAITQRLKLITDEAKRRSEIQNFISSESKSLINSVKTEQERKNEMTTRIKAHAQLAGWTKEITEEVLRRHLADKEANTARSFIGIKQAFKSIQEARFAPGAKSKKPLVSLEDKTIARKSAEMADELKTLNANVIALNESVQDVNTGFGK